MMLVRRNERNNGAPDNRQTRQRPLPASAGFWRVTELSDITISALMANADNARYRAKVAGRNRAVDFP
jgi:GGDEF domain-containing protein